MAKRNFTIKMTGNARPETVSASDLADFIEHVERLLISYAKSEGLELSSDAAVSLVGVGEGSNALTFAAQVEVMPGYVAVAHAINENDYSNLPDETYKNLYEMVELSRKKNRGLELLDASQSISASIQPGKSIDPPLSPIKIGGSTTIVGRCLRVGGVEPKAEIRVTKDQKLLHVAISENIARELAKRLYEEVILDGQATWNAETWEIEDFKVAGVQAYIKRPPSEAFKKLSETTEGRWDGVDAIKYVNSLRGSINE